MRLLIVDLSSILHPLFHVSASKEKGWVHDQTVGTIRHIAKKFDAAAVACDSDTSFRKDISSSYKSNRPEKEPALLDDLRRVKDTLANEFLVWSADGFEADDVIASFVAAMSETDHHVTIASNDKDLAGLVRDGRVSQMMKKETLDTAESVRAKFGVNPEQMRDFLSLVGDASDHIAGAKGVGEKNAAKLLAQFGDLAGIAKAVLIDDDGNGKPALGPPSIRKAILECATEIEIARQLVTLREDVPGIDFAAILEPEEEDDCDYSPEESDRENVAAADAKPAMSVYCADCGAMLPPGDEVLKDNATLCLACFKKRKDREQEAQNRQRTPPPQQKPQQQNQRHQPNSSAPREETRNTMNASANGNLKSARAEKIRALFRAKARELASMFPKSEDGMAMVTRACATACSVSMNLDADISWDSIAEAAMACHHLGLDVGDQAYIYPFKKAAKLTIGPRGLIALAYRSGFVKSIEARCVFKADVDAKLFDYDFGTGQITHKKAPAGRRTQGRPVDLIVNAYSIVETTTNGRIIEVLTAEDLAYYRSFSKAQNGPWVDNYEGMCRKTVIKRILEFVPRSPLLSSALRETDEGAYEIPEELREVMNKAIRARDGGSAPAPNQPPPPQQQKDEDDALQQEAAEEGQREEHGSR